MSTSTQYRRFASIAHSHPDYNALVWPGGTLSYRELASQADILYKKLIGDGVKPGSVIALDGTMTVDSVITVLAIWKLDSIPCPVPRNYGSTWNELFIRTCKPTAVLTNKWDVALSVRQTDVPDFSGVQPALLVGTSGSTGSPKIVVHTVDSLTSSLVATIHLQDEIVDPRGPRRIMESLDSLPNDPLGLVFYTPAELSTVAGWTIFQRAILMGEALVVFPTVDASQILDCMVECSVTNFGATGYIAQKLNREQRGRKVPTPNLLSFGIGGGQVPGVVVRDIDENFGVSSSIGYGLTEMAGPVSMGRLSDSIDIRSSTIGRPLPNFEVRLLDESSEGEGTAVGEVALRSRSCFSGYLDEDSFEVWDRDRFFPTGDIANVACNGIIRILGRRDGLIQRGGVNIDPSEIENAILECSKAEQVAVVGVPSRVAGEQDLVALLVGSELHWFEIRACLQSKLPSLKVPRRCTFVKELPTTRDGSIDRRVLTSWMSSDWRLGQWAI